MQASNTVQFNHVVARIEGWMSTYFLPPFDGSNGIGGPIATHWASSLHVAGPYVMNSYGIIRGLCARARDENAGAARLRAETLALYYLRCQDPTTGIFVCSWGEEPFEGNGLVQQASVAAALWDLHGVWPHRALAEAAQNCWRACLKNARMKVHWRVHNQALRGCEALILGIYARGDSRPTPREKALLQKVGRQVIKSQVGPDTPWAGAIYQALPNDNLIMPYQGKCLAPLIMLAEILADSIYLKVAKQLADFILKNMETEKGGRLLRGQYLAQGPGLEKARKLYRLRHCFPFLEPNLRRHRQRQINHWVFNPWPHWIARGLDTARGLYLVGQALKEEQYISVAMEMVHEALKYQTPLGGLRNTMGFFGEDPNLQGGPVWQDVIPIPRWNSYAIQFLHELARGTPVITPPPPESSLCDEVVLADNLLFRETPHKVNLLSAAGQTKFTLRKGHRWGRLYRAVNKGEGGAATGQRLLKFNADI